MLQISEKIFCPVKKIVLIAWLICLVTTSTVFVYPAEVEFPLIQSMGYFPYSDNSLPEKGKFSVTVDWYYSNIYMFNRQRTTLNDFELLSSTVSVRYGIMEGGTLELYYRHSIIFGGILDKFIEGFHRAFHLPNANRDVYPRFSVHYKFHHYFSYTSGQNGASPLTAAFLKQFYRSAHFSVKARAALGIPLSNKPGFSSGQPFLSTGIMGRYKKKRFSLELSGYLTFFKKPGRLEKEDLYPCIFFSQLEGRLGRWVSGFTFRTSPFKEKEIGHNAYQAYIGYKISRYLQLIIMEDFAPFDTSPDISFNLHIKLL